MISGARVRHEVVEGVGPDGLPAERHRDGGVVGEELGRDSIKSRKTSPTKKMSRKINDPIFQYDTDIFGYSDTVYSDTPLTMAVW